MTWRVCVIRASRAHAPYPHAKGPADRRPFLLAAGTLHHRRRLMFRTLGLAVMAVSRFGLLCIAAIVAGGATAGLADSDSPSVPVQVTAEHRGTPIAAIANPDSSFHDVAVQFTSGKTFGHV